MRLNLDHVEFNLITYSKGRGNEDAFQIKNIAYIFQIYCST